MANSSIRILFASSSDSSFSSEDIILMFSFCLLSTNFLAPFEKLSSTLSAGSKSLKYWVNNSSAFSFLIGLNLHPFLVQ